MNPLFEPLPIWQMKVESETLFSVSRCFCSLSIRIIEKLESVSDYGDSIDVISIPWRENQTVRAEYLEAGGRHLWVSVVIVQLTIDIIS